MIKNDILLFLILSSVQKFSLSQVTDNEDKIRAKNTDTTLGWKKGGIISLGIAQASLTNWAAGGQSSFAVNSLVNVYAHKIMKNSVWENYLDLGYGLLNQGKLWRKTDDKLDFTSKYGQKLKKSIYLAGLVNFKTQFTDGFNYPNDSIAISRFMTPGYLLGAIGIEYRPNNNLTAYLAPFTSKNTFVLDTTLSNQKAFGVDSSKVLRSEFGGYLRINYQVKIMENVQFQTKLEMFSNYLNNPGNIDVSWETLLSMKINKFAYQH
ncbi:MAG: DUF3078 domain-containing protein [Flavobacteriia bacterium]|nr:DUF3078 domain-containing protein [Flavobacteriia bacterium]